MSSDPAVLGTRRFAQHDPVAAAALASIPVMSRDEVDRIVDRLVDAIDVREACEPDVPHWNVGPLIRELERELAHAWGATRRLPEPASMRGQAR